MPEACAALASMPHNLLVGAGEGGLPSDELCDENAQNAMRTAATLDPSNIQAAHMLAAMSSDANDGEGISKASPDFVAALFDDFAESFDEKLGALGYQVPKLVGQARNKPALDPTHPAALTPSLTPNCACTLWRPSGCAKGRPPSSLPPPFLFPHTTK
jgi:hypothetical protein